MEGSVETVEDLQLRSFRRVQLCERNAAATAHSHPLAHRNRSLAVSSRFGICVALGRMRGSLHSMFTADAHRLGLSQMGGNEQPANAENIHIRTIQYYNQQVDMLAISTNSDGNALSIVVQTPNGPFVDIFHIVAFDPKADRQPFPVASIRLGSGSVAHLCDLEWNPMEADLFAAITTDGLVSTVRCAALQPNGNPASSSTTFATFHLPGALCLSWSPKGKQLVVGDAEGRVHQLKPELTGPPVRQIEAPKDVPSHEGQALACTALCWLSTTEWLVSYQPKQQQLLQQSAAPPASIALMVVKKQQSPKWTHWGDVLPTARLGPLTFYPMLDWHMVFLYSPDCTQVALFGQRAGDKWSKLEFETFDIEMPLSSVDGRSNTFPIGAALDFSMITPLLIDQGGGDKVQFPPPPMLHLLNSDGQLLPYAIVSLIGNDEKRPQLNKAAEPIRAIHAHFGTPPPGWVPPTQLPTPTTAVLTQQTENQRPPQQLNAPSQPAGLQTTQSLFQTPPSPTNAPEHRPRARGQAEPPTLPMQTPQMPLPTTSAEEQEKSAAQAAEALRKIKETEKLAELNKQKAEIEERRRQIDALEHDVEQAILQYTRQRNAQTLKLEQLGQLRYEIERRATSTDLSQIDKLGSIRNNMLDTLRQKSQMLDGIYQSIKCNAEAMNQLKISYMESMTNKNAGTSKAAAAPLSFDIQKRCELIEKRYDNTMCKFEQAKRRIAQLDRQIHLHGEYANIGKSGGSDSDEPIDPVSQRKLIQTNDNIAKVCSKLTVRLQQIQRQMELQKSGRAALQKKQQPPPPKQSASHRNGAADIAADFCVLELSQMRIDEGGAKQDGPQAMDLLPSQITSDFHQNLYNCLVDQLKTNSTAPSQIRRIKPLMPSSVHSTQPQTSMATMAAAPSEQELYRKMHEVFNTPQKPQLVSIGVQSPDFLAAANLTDKATPKMTSTPRAARQAAPKQSIPPPAAPTQSTQSKPANNNMAFAGFLQGLPSTTSATGRLPSFSPITTSTTIVGDHQNKPATFTFKPVQQQQRETAASIATTTPTGEGTKSASNNVDLPTTGLFDAKSSPLSTTASNLAPFAQTAQLPKATTTSTTAAEISSTVPLAAVTPTKLVSADAQPTNKPEVAAETSAVGAQKIQPMAAAPIAAVSPAMPANGGGVAQPVGTAAATADEGMMDETTTTAAAVDTGAGATTSAINFNFMKGIGLGAPCAPSTGAPSTGEIRNPFGSITPSQTSGGGANVGLFGASADGTASVFGSKTAFGTPATSFGTPPNRSGGSAFGSFGTPVAASTPATGGSSSFGASPFGGTSGSAFGAKPAFGGGASPFASSGGTSSAFGASPFGGGGGQTTGPGIGAAAGGGGSMFGGGIGGGTAGGGATTSTGATGFSAFASKSSAFGQLASQAQQGAGGGGSLFGGGMGMAAPAGGGGGFSSFGGGTAAGPTPAAGSTITPFGQQKSSAFTMFRK